MRLASISLTVSRDQPSSPYVNFIQYFPGTMDDAEIKSYLEGLETALSDLNSTHVPHLWIVCGARKTAGDVLKHLLGRSVFSQYLGKLRKVSLSLDRKQEDIQSDEILSTPTHFTQDGASIPLSTAQRAEWLLCNRYDRGGECYLQGLLAAARATTATSEAGSQLAISTLSEAGPCVSVRTEEPAEGGKQGDEGSVGVGEARSDAGTEKQAVEEKRDEEDIGTNGKLNKGRVAPGVEAYGDEEARRTSSGGYEDGGSRSDAGF